MSDVLYMYVFFSLMGWAFWQNILAINGEDCLIERLVQLFIDNE